MPFFRLLEDDENSFAAESETSLEFYRQSNKLDSSSFKEISWLDNAKIRYG